MKKKLSLSLITRVMSCFALTLFFSSGIYAQTAKKVPLQDLSSFKDPGKSWETAGEISVSLEEANKIKTEAGSGILVNNPVNHNGEDLFTDFKHGDIDLELDFMMAKESNSGIYLQGRYEFQLLDSWTTKVPTSGDNGGIYERWDESRPEGKKGYQGYAPRQNASRAPGVWQHLEISFQAPRFDENGNKVENAKIISAVLNGVTIHENVALLGPTRGAIGDDEVAAGPLRFQGDHGAIAFRDISVTRYDQPAPTISDLQYKVFEGVFTEKPDTDTLKAIKSGQPELLTANLGQLPDQFLLQYTGTLNTKKAGEYRFNVDVSGGSGFLEIDGKNGTGGGDDVRLSEGEVPFRLLYARRSDWNAPKLEFSVSGEGLRSHLLSDASLAVQGGANPIYIKAEEKPLQRSFMDLPNGTRISHAVSVSSQDNVHYTYDLKHGNLVQVWRGGFLNATPMWYSRGDGSSRPDGSIEYLLEEPSFAVDKLDNKNESWSSDTSGVEFITKGYTLDGNDNPVFKYDIYGTSVEDKIRVVEDGKGIERTLNFQDADDLYVRLAIGQSIRKEDGKNRYLIDDQSYYLEISSSSGSEPFIRSEGDHQELIMPAQSTLNYTILF